MKPVLKKEVDETILALSAINKLTRLEGFNEIRALSHSLKAIRWPLEKFIFPKDLHWGPLQDFEERKLENGKYWIVNCRSQEKNFKSQRPFKLTLVLC